KWNSNPKGGGVSTPSSINEPSPTVTTQNRLGVAFITKAFSSNSGKSVNAGSSTEDPCPTIAAQNRLGLAQAHFITNGGKHHNSDSVDGPVGAIRTGDGTAKVSASFIQKYYSSGGQ